MPRSVLVALVSVLLATPVMLPQTVAAPAPARTRKPAPAKPTPAPPGARPPQTAAQQKAERAQWAAQAARINIVRDDWGVAHVSAATDSDAVFGAIYAQAEDDFHRIEANYMASLGRTAEAEGEAAIYRDLRQRLYYSPEALKKQYAASPVWLRKLMDSWAGGLNYYLSTHPSVQPRVIARFEPWMALSFTEGSIGGDIERIDLAGLEALYGGTTLVARAADPSLAPNAEPNGSNGIALAPTNTANRATLLLINPHTSFFFRSELHMVSREGLNAYGAATWGQFFIYQGFNDKAGWMHTSSGVDAVDEYLETITKTAAGYTYTVGSEQRPVTKREIAIAYKDGDRLAERKFTVYQTHHGPVVRADGAKWVAFQMMHEPVKALQQSFLRTKANGYTAFRETMNLMANSSNNTVFAAADGTIAYFHGNYIPRRDTHFDWNKPVDGANAATEYKGLHTVDEIPQLKNPASGWIYNSNNWPWSAAGPSSPKKEMFPQYVEKGQAETPRGSHAIRLLANKKDFTLETLVAAAYDSYLPWFEKTIPTLLYSWEGLRANDPLKAPLAEPVRMLRAWDFRWNTSSIATTLAIFWGEEIQRRFGDEARKAGSSVEDFVALGGPKPVLAQALSSAIARLTSDFGTWRTAWGEVNRFQRLTGAIEQPFSDAQPSIPVGFTSGNWGSLASFGAHAYPGTKKWYGTTGNSFVAAVEFLNGRVRAVAVTAGGESGAPGSAHFNDQAARYAAGDLRPVYFYPEQLAGHIEREYHPGQ